MNVDLFGCVEGKRLEGIDREENGVITAHPSVDFVFQIALSSDEGNRNKNR